MATLAVSNSPGTITMVMGRAGALCSGTHRSSHAKLLAVSLVLFACTLFLFPLTARAAIGPEPEQPKTESKTETTTETPGTAAGIRPRAELHVASVKRLIEELHRSRAGVFSADFWHILLESSENTSKGLNHEELNKIVEQVRSCQDTAIHGATFAPDTEGRMRWALRLDWPIRDLHDRVKSVLSSDTAQELLRGIKIKEQTGGGFVITLSDSELAYLLPVGGSQSIIASHADLVPPSESTTSATTEGESKEPPLITCRLNLTATEVDSGATMFSDFSVLTAVTYIGRVNTEGEWLETVQLDWPPISGMGAKVFLGRVKQTFFVPNEAFFAAAMNSSVAPGMLESMAGFGPQVMFGDSGFEVVGAESLGPVSSRMDSELCVTVLPGKGFLPAPDIAIQTKSGDPDSFAEDIREAVEEVNKVFRERDQKEPWKESTVRDRTIFWNDGGAQGGGFMMPLSMHPVLFMTKETDAKGKEKDFLVMGWTSTSPEAFVRRWLDLPRNKDRRHLPSNTKTDGELWVNWKQLYRWTHPYFDMALNAGGIRSLLPKFESVQEKLTDATITLDLNYTGLVGTHKGPLPLGTLTVPALVAGSLAEDSSGQSDLSRERFASRRLKVLYHHSKLFQKDLGRWPAEIEELDGYVDFEGNPHLLHLQLSAKKQWSEWIEGIFEVPEKSKGEEDEEEIKFDDDLYVIKWGKDRWSLGYAPNTFEHLESLYIDEQGTIHRKERKVEKQTAPPPDAPVAVPPEPASVPAEQPKEQTQ